MYKIKFNTRDFHSRRNRKNWEDVLRNDFAVSINGKEFVCKTEDDLKNRLKIIAGYDIENNDKAEMLVLNDERYGERKLQYVLYGFAQGYVDIDKLIFKVGEEGYAKIPFSSFYDMRQAAYKFYKGCYIEIIREDI